MRKLMIGMHVALIAALLLATGALAQEGDPVKIELAGTVTAIDLELGTFTVETEEGEVYTVIPPEDFDLTGLQVGAVVEVEGTVNEDGSVLAQKVEVQEIEDDDEVDEDEGDGNYFCRASTEEQHPVAAGIAETYEVDYDQVMAWFCGGQYGFGQIMLALMTEGKTGTSADELLVRRTGGEGWGQIWISMKLIGEPSDAEPPARPENVGVPDELGPPDGVGAPEGAGPPDDAGPPDTIGPPDGAGRPSGRP